MPERTSFGGGCSLGKLKGQDWVQVTHSQRPETLTPKEVTVYRGTLMSIPEILNGS